MKHIVLVTRVLPHHSIGGMQSIAWDLARELSSHGNHVTILTTEVEGYPARFVDDGVEIHALERTNWRRYGRRWWHASRGHFRKHLMGGCDAVFSVSAGAIGLLPLRAEMGDVPFIMQAHGTSWGEVVSKWKAMSPKALLSSGRNLLWVVKDALVGRQFDAIVAVGPAVARDLTRLPYSLSFDAKRIHVIANGVDAKKFRVDRANRDTLRLRCRWSADCRVIVTACRLDKQKGVHLAIDAFALLASRFDDIRLLVIGDGPFLDDLRAQVYRLELSERVSFTGGISREDMPAYLQASDAMLFTTTRVEGLPLNVLEALACGLPVVASNHLFDLDSKPSDHGLYEVDPHDINGVADALALALERSGRTDSLLKPEYTLAECVRAYIQLLGQLASAKRIT